MSDLETRLEAALTAQTPARNPMFRVQIMLRREQAAFRRRLLGGVLMALAVAVAAALALGMLGRTTGTGPLWVALVAGAGVVMMAALMVSVAGARPAFDALAMRVRSRLGGSRWY